MTDILPDTLHSCLYEGIVRHRRYKPRRREFRYRLYMLYIDLAEIHSVTHHGLTGWLHRLGLMRFRRADHPGDPEEALDVTVRDLVKQQLGRRPAGPIRLLTQPRHLGYVINPISLYYCFTEDGSQLDSVVAEVISTPWRERHCYVLDCRKQGSTSRYRERTAKQMHVSPFLPMELEYRWLLTCPGQNLLVHLEDMENGLKGSSQLREAEPERAAECLLDATLSLRRRSLAGTGLLLNLLICPWMTVRIAVAIYYQALLLWWQRTPFYPHPAQARADGCPAGEADVN